jgi:hypothetical protein
MAGSGSILCGTTVLDFKMRFLDQIQNEVFRSFITRF